MDIKSLICRIGLVVMTLLLGSTSVARAEDPRFSPVGEWELSVSGKINGYTAVGIAYAEFSEDGAVSGVALVRNSSSISMIQGYWAWNGNRIMGEMEVTGDTNVSFEFTGAAKVGKSLSVKCMNTDGDRITLAGKSLVSLPDRSGAYEGTIRQYGLVGSLSIDLDQLPGMVGGEYGLSGVLFMAGSSYTLSGTAVVNRQGAFIACVTNVDTGHIISLSGKITSQNVMTGAGKDLIDGSTVKIKVQ